MEIILLVGRIIFGGFFFMMGMMHLKNLKSMSAYAASKGTPSPALAVAAPGLNFAGVVPTFLRSKKSGSRFSEADIGTQLVGRAPRNGEVRGSILRGGSILI